MKGGADVLNATKDEFDKGGILMERDADMLDATKGELDKEKMQHMSFRRPTEANKRKRTIVMINIQ